jgi:4-amino-4-deoxy-L-arabinose transferase-like glycosyltransferase
MRGKPIVTARLAIVAVLLLAAGLRFVGLERVPPPFNVDEAMHAYDAYALLKTGRDQWGNAWPITMRAFNDYRRPAATYTAIPFIATFGLTITGIRAMGAFWGWMAVLLTYRLASDLFGQRTGILAALMLALSPWHINFSRMGLEVSGPLLATLLAGLDCGWRWYERRDPRWLFAAAVAFGLSFYTYTPAQAFTPLLLLACGLLFFRRIVAQWRSALPALLLIALIAAPLAHAVLTNAQSWNRLAALSLFSEGWLPGLTTAARQWAGHFAPGYLFLRGDASPIHHPQYGGQLLWIDALLIPAGLVALAARALDRRCGPEVRRRRRKAAGLLLAWIALGPVPAALTRQDMGSANAMRGVAGLPGWAILAGLGLAALWRAQFRPTHAARNAVQRVLRGALALALVVNAGLVLHHYATEYPVEAARAFEYGIREAMAYAVAHEDAYDTIVLTDWISQPHIFAVVFRRTDPRTFQQHRAPYGDRLSEKLRWWGDTYRTGDAEQLYAELEHGLFIVRPHMLPDVTPVRVIHHPDGTPAFKIIAK